MLPKEEEEECENESYHRTRECENDGTASMELNQCCEPLHQGQVQQAGNWKASQQIEKKSQRLEACWATCRAVSSATLSQTSRRTQGPVPFFSRQVEGETKHGLRDTTSTSLCK